MWNSRICALQSQIAFCKEFNVVQNHWIMKNRNDYTCIAPDMWLLYLQFTLSFITKIILQPVNLCTSKNFMIPPFTDHTNAYMQSILHLLLDNLPKLYVLHYKDRTKGCMHHHLTHTIVKCYRLVIIQLEVSSLSANLK